MARPRSDIAPRLVHAARARFLEQGVDGASLRQIAEDAGTSIGMVYYYHPTKDDLFLAVVEEVYVALLADIEAALAPRSSVEERIRRLYERLGRLSADELLVMRIVIREMLASPARLERLVQRFQRGHLPLVVALIREGFTTGFFDPALPPAIVLIAMMLLGGPAQVMLQNAPPALPLRPPTGAALAGHLLDVFLRGVAARRRRRRTRKARNQRQRSPSPARTRREGEHSPRG